MAKYWISQWHPFIWRLSWTRGPSHTLIQNSRKLSKKQITYSMNMTQEGATNSCNKQFIEKSIWKLFLDFTGMEIVRSQTGPARSRQHCLFLRAIKWTPATAEPRAITVKAAKPLPLPNHIHFLQQTVMNQKVDFQSQSALASAAVQATSIPSRLSLQGKPPKEGRHSSAMLKLLVQWKYKHCCYYFNNAKEIIDIDIDLISSI